MYFERFYLACISHASYMIGSEGVATVIDPQRDVSNPLACCSAPALGKLSTLRAASMRGGLAAYPTWFRGSGLRLP
jgi:hypothetical protein